MTQTICERIEARLNGVMPGVSVTAHKEDVLGPDGVVLYSPRTQGMTVFEARRETSGVLVIPWLDDLLNDQTTVHDVALIIEQVLLGQRETAQ